MNNFFRFRLYFTHLLCKFTVLLQMVILIYVFRHRYQQPCHKTINITNIDKSMHPLHSGYSSILQKSCKLGKFYENKLLDQNKDTNFNRFDKIKKILITAEGRDSEVKCHKCHCT